MTLDHESDDIWKLAEAKQRCKKQFYFQNTKGISLWGGPEMKKDMLKYDSNNFFILGPPYS